MHRVTLDLNSETDRQQIKGVWRRAVGLVPGQPNQGLTAEIVDSPARLADYDDASWETCDNVGDVVSTGFAFCWWARLHLGRLWSASVARKQGHRIVDTGPYGLVRHPIYTGMLGMLIATGMAISHWIALLAALLIFFIGTIIRVRSEDRLLREAFGEQFKDYANRVPAIVPGLF